MMHLLTFPWQHHDNIAMAVLDRAKEAEFIDQLNVFEQKTTKPKPGQRR